MQRQHPIIDLMSSLAGSASRDLAAAEKARADLEARLTPDVRWQSDAFDGIFEEGIAKSSSQALEFVEAIRTAFPEFKAEVTGIFPAESGRETAFEFRFSGTNLGHLANVGVTGRPVEVTGVGIASFDAEGRLVNLRTTWNCARILAQLGMRAHMRFDPVPLEQRAS